MIKEWTPPRFLENLMQHSPSDLLGVRGSSCRALTHKTPSFMEQIYLQHRRWAAIMADGPSLLQWFRKKKYTLLPLWADTLFLHKATRTGEYMVTHLGSQVESNSGDITILYPGEFPISLQHVSSGLWARKQVAKKKRNRQGGTGVARDKQM